MRKRRRKPLRTRIVYYVTNGTLVVQRAAPRVLIYSATDPYLTPRKWEAQRIARRTGGHVHRLTKHRRFKPIEAWWADA